jgi:hypothetical protein
LKWLQGGDVGTRLDFCFEKKPRGQKYSATVSSYFLDKTKNLAGIYPYATWESGRRNFESNTSDYLGINLAPSKIQV